MDENGSLGGFSRHFCDWLSDIFNIPFELKIHRLTSLDEGMRDGTIDFTGAYSITPERLEKYFATGAIAERSVWSFRLKESELPGLIARGRPLRYGFPQDFGTSKLVRSAVDVPIEEVFFQRREQAVAALRSGAIDAFIMDARAQELFDGQDDVVGEIFSRSPAPARR